MKVKTGYNKSKETEPLILEPEDWTPEEWIGFCKMAGDLPPEQTERIVFSEYTLETFIDDEKPSNLLAREESK